MGSGRVMVRVMYECGLCDATEIVWIPLYEDKAGTFDFRPDGWIHTQEKGMVCEECWDARTPGDFNPVRRGL